MPGGAGQLSVAAAVRAPAQVPSPRGRPGWPSTPSAVTRVRSGRPAGVAGARMSGRRPGWSLPCPRPGPAVGRPSSPSSGRPTSSVRCPVSRCPVSGRPVSGRPVFRLPVFRCPDGQACAVRGNAAARSASRWTWSGWVWGPAGWAQWVEVPRCPRRVVACIGPDGKRWCGGWPCPAATRSTVAPGPTLGRRPGCGAAWPPGRHGLVQGQAAGRVGEPGTQCSPVPPQGVWAVAGVVPDHGLGPRGGDHAGWSLG
jgi:hypothetical protein